jgi:hypothetical protein
VVWFYSALDISLTVQDGVTVQDITYTGSNGNIDQRILGRSIAAEIALHSREAGEVTRENAAIKKLAAQFNSVP